MESTRSLIDLDTEEAALLPPREVMAVVNFAFVHAVNPSIALNLASEFSDASSAALQDISVSQG